MDAACLDHCLTDGERDEFEERGFLIVPDALDATTVAHMSGVADEVFADAVAAGHDPKTVLVDKHILARGPEFVALVDHPKILPKIWGILGWNIFLYHTRLVLSPPDGEAANDKTLFFHQDSGRVNFDIRTKPRPRLSMKAAYFLSDVSEPGRGNFWILPGSHVRDDIELPEGGEGQPEGAVPICVKPGTCVLFERRLWHSASPNPSKITRKVVFCGYGYRWMRLRDDHTAEALIPAASDPIRRQLLGGVVTDGGYYVPTEEDVPLRTWLREHRPADAE